MPALLAGAGMLIAAGVATGAEKMYVNPILHADYSDPDVVASADGKTFYMTASSFQCTPGLPILKSNDLVNWEVVNHALDSVTPVDFYGSGVPRHGKGVWAPCIRLHNGEYYIYWGDPDFGIYMVKSNDPEGKWSKPVLVRGGKGLIDPTPLWDDDGRAYLANGWASSRSGFNSVITVSEMSADGSCVLSEPRIVFDGNDGINHTVEGPKFYKRDGYYYLLAPAGGVATGWQLAMRSPAVYGPYESKIVMAQGNTEINGPHQGALVTTSRGDDWFVHFQDKGPYGRVLHLNPVEWLEGWPVIGSDPDGDGCGEPVATHAYPLEPSPVKEHDASKWFQWQANYTDFYGFDIPHGLKRIYSHKTGVNLWEVPNLWLMKFPAEEFTFDATVEIAARGGEAGTSAGVVVMGLDYCRLGLTLNSDGDFVLQRAVCLDAEHGSPETITDIAVLKPDEIFEAGLLPVLKKSMTFRISVSKGAVCRLAYSLDGKRFTPVEGEFVAVQGKWIGAKTGVYNIMPATGNDRGWIDVLNVTVR